MSAPVKKERKIREDVETQVVTIHLGRATKHIAFKKKAPRAIREIKKFATELMRTKDVRVSPELNKFVWSNGVRRLPRRVRVRISRRRNEDEEAKEPLYSYCEYVPVDSFEGLGTVKE